MDKSATIAFVFASRERPNKFFDCLDNIRAMAKSKNYFVWAKLDNDDPLKQEYKSKLAAYPEVFVQWGLSKNKVHAINRDLEHLPDCDILIMMSDDMQFLVRGFDEEIREAFKNHFPNFDGTVHYPDSHALSKTITLSIIGVSLYKQLGYLYWHEYVSVFADNDFTELTRKIGKYVFVNKKILEHYHPIWKTAEWDAQYRRTEDKEIYKSDREIFLRRKANNFGL